MRKQRVPALLLFKQERRHGKIQGHAGRKCAIDARENGLAGGGVYQRSLFTAAVMKKKSA
jgi:hypothetical protein